MSRVETTSGVAFDGPYNHPTIYDRDGTTFWCAESERFVQHLRFPRPPVVITDPVWPNGKRAFPNVDPWKLWKAVAPQLAKIACRLIVILGCDSDPRFLAAVPKSMPFVRVCKLRYASPSYKGALLVDFETAYVFGESFINGDGEHRVLPGEARARRSTGRPKWNRPGAWSDRDDKRVGMRKLSNLDSHPCPRNERHMTWLVENFTRPDDIIFDPFMGSGTTLWAARELGRASAGVEIDRRWCEEAKERLAQAVMFAPTVKPDPKPAAPELFT